MRMELATPWQRDRVESIIRKPDKATRPELIVRWGPMELVGRWLEGTITHQNNGIIALDASLRGRMPKLYPRSRVEVDVLMDGIPVRLFTGFALKPRRKEGVNTDLLASSAGIYLEKRKFNQQTRFSHWLATDVIYDCAMRAPYEPSLIEVPSMPQPKVDLLYERETPIHNGIDESIKDTDLTYMDFPDGGFKVLKLPNPIAPGEPDWTYDIQRDALLGTWKWEPQEDEYTSVVVYKRGEDNRDLFPPVEAQIMYEDRTPPPEDVTAYIELSDYDYSIGASEYAYTLATEIADRYSRGVYAAEVTVPFNPLLTRNSIIPITEFDREPESGVIYHREWIFVVSESVVHRLSGVMRTSLSMTGTIVQESVVDPGPSTDPPRRGARMIPVIISGDHRYIRSTETWIRKEEDRLRVYPALSGGIAWTEEPDHRYIREI